MNQRVWRLASALTIVAGLAGCSTEDSPSPSAHADSSTPSAEEFVSDNPGADHLIGWETGGNGGGSAGTGGGAAGAEDEAEKAIVEADIVQVQGDKLYALSQYGGLAVVDVANPDKLSMLGRWRARGTPSEMYLRDGVALAMYSSFGHLEYNEPTHYQWVDSSRVVALDVSDPAAIKQISVFDIPGSVSDTRMVGNVMYVVSHEWGDCWECVTVPRTTVTSLDVSDPKAIHKLGQLAYDNQTTGYSWSRSISVTQDRVYISGPQAGIWDGTSDNSTIHVVDIKDPAGKLVHGASVPVKGQIQSRWQMDESQGVLRVISQPGLWNSTGTPVVQTFQVESSLKLNPLGELTMDIPAGERLQSVRFDGTRGYAVTSVKTDPLFVLDLTDPTKPRQVGELKMPGFLYHMEPRGNRMIALGRDNGNTDGGLTVSVFDVTDITKPSMLSRVNFGGNWGWLPEDQDRIHKAFRIFDTEKLIVVPFSGSTYDSNNCYNYSSGVQLIDLDGDQLKERGVVPQHGEAKRAILHKGRLLAVSDERISSFDISDRDKPGLKSDLAFVHKSQMSKVVGDVVAQISSDWWNNQAKLVLTPLSDPERGQPLAELDLQSLTANPQGNCNGHYGGFFNSRLFANGKKLYLLWDQGYYHDLATQTPTSLAVFDLSDPQHPTLEANVTLAIPNGWSWFSPNYVSGYGWNEVTVSAGESVVQNGSTLAVLSGVVPYLHYDSSNTKPVPTLSLVDLSKPSEPRIASSIVLPTGTNRTMLQIDGTTVLSSHGEALPNDPSKAKFYIDRFDISNPAQPLTLPSINTPGSLLSYDHGSNRAMTVDYRRETIVAADSTECFQKGGTIDGEFIGDYFKILPEGKCIRYHRTFRLVQLKDAGAKLMDSLDVDDGTIQSISVGQDRVFIMHGNWNWYGGEQPNEVSLQMLSGMAAGDLQASGKIAIDSNPYAWGSVVAIAGQKAILTGYYPPHITVYDASNPIAPQLVKKSELFGYLYQVEVSGDKAICSLGDWGLQSVSLSN